MAWARCGWILPMLLALAACGAEVEAPAPPAVPGFGGSGGEVEPDDCDRDGDGEIAASCAGADCNDRNPDVHSGAAEVCDGITDENCDGSVDEGCDCVPGEVRPCFPDEATRHVGACVDGLQRCTGEGAWGSCEGAVLPVDEGESCDGIDQDCDGTADEDVRNACGLCGEAPVEICGNGLDDDCDGTRDDPDRCSVRCDGVDWDDPAPLLACCVETFDGRASATTPSRTTWVCVEVPGLPPCSERPCLDLDGDPASVCTKSCVDTDGDGGVDRCLCGEALPGHDPVAYAGCGFESACALQDCAERRDQPCYSGPPQTLGVGICRGGHATCEAGEEGRAWSACVGEVLPALEICGNGIDDDCDGAIDEADGATGVRCPLPACPPEATERCGNGIDDDCDRVPDDGCAASSEEQSCYGGPIGTRDVGLCRGGTQRAIDGRWGPCEGQVLPAPERCGDGVDSDCNGLGGGAIEDPGCCTPAGEESCNGVDDDCDGLIDEGVTNACGRCDDTCFATPVGDPADCAAADRSCERVGRDPLDPAALTLSSEPVPEPSWLYLGYYLGGGGVMQIDTATGAVNWETSIADQVRDVVAAHDGTVWATSFQRVYHLGADGEVICQAQFGEAVQSAGVDARGDLWVATWVTPLARLYRIDRDAVEPPAASQQLPHCVLHDLAPAEPNRISTPTITASRAPASVQAAADGSVWLASSPVFRWDGSSWSAPLHGDSWITGGALDRAGAFWVGGQALVRITAEGTITSFPVAPAGTRIAHVLATRDGSIWSTVVPASIGAGHGILHFDPVAEAATFHSLGTPQTTWLAVSGLGEDRLGRIWTLHENVPRVLEPSTGTWTDRPAAGGSGGSLVAGGSISAVGKRALPRGTWTQIVDAGFHDVEWTGLDWEGSVPAEAGVSVEISFSATRAGLAAARCGPFANAPADLGSCTRPRGRFARIEMRLTGGPQGERPSIRNVVLHWSRP